MLSLPLVSSSLTASPMPQLNQVNRPKHPDSVCFGHHKTRETYLISEDLTKKICDKLYGKHLLYFVNGYYGDTSNPIYIFLPRIKTRSGFLKEKRREIEHFLFGGIGSIQSRQSLYYQRSQDPQYRYLAVSDGQNFSPLYKANMLLGLGVYQRHIPDFPTSTWLFSRAEEAPALPLEVEKEWDPILKQFHEEFMANQVTRSYLVNVDGQLCYDYANIPKRRS
jgi:hypothetical protein